MILDSSSVPFAGQNTHFLLSILIKHLDHKNVLKLPDMQLEIVRVSTSLAQDATVEPSMALIGALSDVMRHLRKSIHSSLDDANLGPDVIKWNRSLAEAVDDCLVQLSHKVVVRFNISWIKLLSKTPHYQGFSYKHFL